VEDADRTAGADRGDAPFCGWRAVSPRYTASRARSYGGSSFARAGAACTGSSIAWSNMDSSASARSVRASL
jgi:hypothetical protein